MSKESEHTGDEDANLVASWRKGDLSSFEFLVHKYQKRMLNIAYRITGNYEDGCEVVQDAFLAAHRAIDSFRGEARFSTWLTSITVNHARNRLQQTQIRRKNESALLDDPPPLKSTSHPAEPASFAPSPLEELERTTVEAKLSECIGRLPVEFRETLVLRDMQGYSYDELAGILKVQAGTVKSRLFRARELVKDCLKMALGAA